ncbi:hypothetical protein [Alteribacter natronophilus]|uniref:hypothetical protein n=1 Tax=Alteribacter natronophilus TaxID=2583810 RepID=UPI00110E0AF4|nr:hypothetical protein [Alteribacter natronophilus]TMW74041.1 hypothetical protein FGB90_00700 [Alteribacter natronophilus]
MDRETKGQFERLEGSDRELQMEAFSQLTAQVDEAVDWSYEVWDELVSWLGDRDNHRRARGAQLLAGLAKSDPENRILDDFPALWKVTKDEKFVTLRHSLQSIWKVALGGKEQHDLVMAHLDARYREPDHKHATLIRYDIITGLKALYDETGDPAVRDRAQALIEMEEDEKYRKKYRKVWK